MLVKFAGGGKYEVTPEDRLWLLRAVQQEGRPREAVARALLNLHALLRSRGSRRSLSSTVRAYAQPVNPRWYPDGDLFLKSVRSMNASSRAKAVKRAEARRDVHSVRSDFAPDVVAAVDAALGSGWASDVTDYAAPTLDAAGKGYVPRSKPEPGVNRLWSRAPGWSGYEVEQGGGTSVVPLVLLALVVVAWSALKG